MILLLPLVGALILVWEAWALQFDSSKTITNFVRTRPHLALIIGIPFMVLLGYVLHSGGN